MHRSVGIVRVGKPACHFRHRQTERVGGDLGEDRIGPGADVGGGVGDFERAVGAEHRPRTRLHHHRFPDARRHAETDELMAIAHRPRRRGAPIPREPLRALPEAGAKFLRRVGLLLRLVGLGVVTQAQFDRIDARCVGEFVHRDLDGNHAVSLLRHASNPVIVAGGGVLYSGAEKQLAAFAEKHGIPVLETQAGKSALPHDHSRAMGAVGVTGTSAANAMAQAADVILAVGTRLADFTTGSSSLFQNPAVQIIGLNVQPFDAAKHRSHPLVADAQVGLVALGHALHGWRAETSWIERSAGEKANWIETAATYTVATNAELPSDAQVIGAAQRMAQPTDVVLCAAGGLPGELHKHWNASTALGYHAEYGFSCMGYEIAGALGVKMADPSREVFVFIGDGSYLMMNSELATSVMLGMKITLVLLDNGGYGCINRLQQATGGAPFNNLLVDTRHVTLPHIDFVAHAAAWAPSRSKPPGLPISRRSCGKRAENPPPRLSLSTRMRARARMPAGPGGMWLCPRSRCDTRSKWHASATRKRATCSARRAEILHH